MLFIKHCTDSRSTCSKFIVLPCYMPIDSSLRNAKPLSCKPQGQLFGFHSCLGHSYSLLFRLYWLNSHGCHWICDFCVRTPCKLLRTGNHYDIGGAIVPKIDALVLSIVQLQLSAAWKNGEKLEMSWIRAPYNNWCNIRSISHQELYLKFMWASGYYHHQ